jgi:hypothetical protein
MKSVRVAALMKVMRKAIVAQWEGEVVAEYIADAFAVSASTRPT